MTEAGFDPPAGFTAVDRAAWAAIGRGRAPADAAPPSAGPVDRDEWTEVFVPLAHLVGIHLEARADLRKRLGAAGLPQAPHSPVLIALGGSVSAGKTTFATVLADLLRARHDHPRVDVLSTDGFLRSTADLGARAGYKGFPDTYDDALIDRVLGSLAAGVERVEMPRYSHERYDRDGEVVLGPTDVVLIEGVNALGRPAAFCTLSIYLDVAEADVRSWYVTRFVGLIEAARDDPRSFFAQWTGLSPPDAERLAVSVWEGINLPNLERHIEPTRWRADIVVHKKRDHRVDAVAVRAR